MIGIDDWVWRRGQRYGTLICDLERRQVIELLPDREPAIVEAWLMRQPQIEVVARDRNGGYGGAVARACTPERGPDRGSLASLDNVSARFWRRYDGRCRRSAAPSARQTSIRRCSPRQNACMENRSGLVVQAELTHADGHGERKAALEMVERRSPGSSRL